MEEIQEMVVDTLPGAKFERTGDQVHLRAHDLQYAFDLESAQGMGKNVLSDAKLGNSSFLETCFQNVG